MLFSEKLELIEQFHQLASAFDDTLNLNQKTVLFRPAPDAWSIIEQVVHCADFDTANFLRYRRAITSPGTCVLPFDSSWTALLRYQDNDLSLSIQLIKSVRTFMSSHLRLIADSDWSQYDYTFPNGSGFSLENALLHFNEHVGFHRKLIDRNIIAAAKSENSPPLIDTDSSGM